MSKINYENKVAINIDPSIPDINKCKADDMNEIKQVVNENETKELLAISNIAPNECSTGDMYFNTSSKKIFTATATNTWGATGETPTDSTLYINDGKIYTYDGDTLVNVGGTEEVEVSTTQPTNTDVKLWINPSTIPQVKGGGVFKKVFELGTPVLNQNLKYYPINNVNVSEIVEQFDYLFVTLKKITQNDDKKPFTMVISTHNFAMDDSQQYYSSMTYDQVINEVGDSPYLKVYEISFFYLNGNKVNIQPLYCIPYDSNAGDPTLEYDIDTIVGIKY